MHVSLCLGTLLALATCGWSHAAELRPLAWYTGADSGIEDRSYRLIQAGETWAATWLEHQGRTAQQAFQERLPTLAFDFDRCTVIALFQGDGINSRALSIERVDEEETRIVIYYDVWTYQTDAGGAADRATAYGFLVLPKTEKPIVLQENTQGLKNRPPKWTQRATLDAGQPVVKPTLPPRRNIAPPPPVRLPR